MRLSHFFDLISAKESINALAIKRLADVDMTEDHADILCIKIENQRSRSLEDAEETLESYNKRRFSKISGDVIDGVFVVTGNSVISTRDSRGPSLRVPKDALVGMRYTRI